MKLIRPGGKFDTVYLRRKAKSVDLNKVNVMLWWGNENQGGPVGLFVDEASAREWCRLKELRVFSNGPKDKPIDGRIQS